jgi:hypothetical protein
MRIQVDATLGAMEIGVGVSHFLMGISTLQAFLYYKNFPRDPRMLRTLVTVICFLELAHTIGIAHVFYTLSVHHYGDQNILDSPKPYSLTVSGIVGTTVICLSQIFFANRIHKCFGKLHIPIVCWALILLQFLTDLTITIQLFLTSAELRSRLLLGSRTNWDWILFVNWVSGVVADIIITCSLCYYLTRSRQRSISKRTIRLADRITAITIQTGLVTSLTVIVMTIVFLQTKGTCGSTKLSGRTALREMAANHTTVVTIPNSDRAVTPAIEIEVSQVTEVRWEMRHRPSDEELDVEKFVSVA